VLAKRLVADSPEALRTVKVEGFVPAQDRHPLGRTLRDDEPVERISMMERKVSQKVEVTRLDG
jgi:hypothetical protein